MDNEHCRITNSVVSCGILEVYSITEDPAKVMYALGTHLYHPARGNPAAFILFSGIAEGGNASLLAKYISEAFKAVCHCHPYAVENPKTANFINWWMWEIPHDEFKVWWKAERIKKIKMT